MNGRPLGIPAVLRCAWGGSGNRPTSWRNTSCGSRRSTALPILGRKRGY